MDDFKRAITGKNFDVQYIEQWFDFPPYIDALAGLIYESISEMDSDDFHLLYSAHSLPQSFIDEGDPYLDHIKATIEKVNRRLSEPPYNVSDFKWHLSFQSKTGPVKWLEPSTEETIIELGKKGCRDLIVVPISFVSDHIETLYEIDILYKDLAAQHGITLRRCQSLNTSEKFISALRELVLQHLK
jgi:ferrochelatase